MKWPTIGLLAASVALMPSGVLGESSLILARTDFPAHTIIKSYHDVGNIAFDKAQGCHGALGTPYFHRVCADALNRIGGWVESGAFLGKTDSQRQIGFDVVASSFQSPTDATHAYSDFVHTVQGPDWGGEWRDAPRSITAAFSSSAAEFRLADPMDGIWGESIVHTSGSSEIEAVVFWSEKRDAARAKSCLTKLMVDAIALDHDS